MPFYNIVLNSLNDGISMIEFNFSYKGCSRPEENRSVKQQLLELRTMTTFCQNYKQ